METAYLYLGLSGLLTLLLWAPYIWAQVFLLARLGHAIFYILGVPYLRTPVYPISWAAVLMIGAQLR